MTFLKPIALCVLIPFGLSAGVPAMAEGGGLRGAAMFEEADANGDGALSLAELQAAADGSGQFGRADADGDGAITRAEMLAGMAAEAEARADRFFQSFDGNGDGSVTEAEIAEARAAREEERDSNRRARMLERLFERADQDEDGVISAEEFEAVQARMGEHRQGRGEGRDERRGGLFGNRG